MDFSDENNNYKPNIKKINNFKKLNEISLNLESNKELDKELEVPYTKNKNDTIKLNEALIEKQMVPKKDEENIESIDDQIKEIKSKIDKIDNDEINNLKDEITKITNILEYLVDKQQ